MSFILYSCLESSFRPTRFRLQRETLQVSPRLAPRTSYLPLLRGFLFHKIPYFLDILFLDLRHVVAPAAAFVGGNGRDLRIGELVGKRLHHGIFAAGIVTL